MNSYEQMREALNNIGNAAAWIAENCNDQQTSKYMNDVIAMVQSALFEPPRNCDVGSAEEQSDRFEDYCMEHKNGRSCRECSFNENLNMCALEWAQMPYEAEEGGTI